VGCRAEHHRAANTCHMAGQAVVALSAGGPSGQGGSRGYAGVVCGVCCHFARLANAMWRRAGGKTFRPGAAPASSFPPPAGVLGGSAGGLVTLHAKTATAGQRPTGGRTAAQAAASLHYTCLIFATAWCCPPSASEHRAGNGATQRCTHAGISYLLLRLGGWASSGTVSWNVRKHLPFSL